MKKQCVGCPPTPHTTPPTQPIKAADFTSAIRIDSPMAPNLVAYDQGQSTQPSTLAIAAGSHTCKIAHGRLCMCGLRLRTVSVHCHVLNPAASTSYCLPQIHFWMGVEKTPRLTPELVCPGSSKNPFCNNSSHTQQPHTHTLNTPSPTHENENKPCVHFWKSVFDLNGFPCLAVLSP